MRQNWQFNRLFKALTKGFEESPRKGVAFDLLLILQENSKKMYDVIFPKITLLSLSLFSFRSYLFERKYIYTTYIYKNALSVEKLPWVIFSV
jgi:hypothetical protein